MVSVTLDRFGRIVVPKEVRERYGWTPGSKLVLELEDGGVRLERVEAAERGRGLIIEQDRMAFDAKWIGATEMSAEQVRAALEEDRDEHDADALEAAEGA